MQATIKSERSKLRVTWRKPQRDKLGRDDQDPTIRETVHSAHLKWCEHRRLQADARKKRQDGKKVKQFLSLIGATRLVNFVRSFSLRQVTGVFDEGAIGLENWLREQSPFIRWSHDVFFGATKYSVEGRDAGANPSGFEKGVSSANLYCTGIIKVNVVQMPVLRESCFWTVVFSPNIPVVCN